jgi:hypothetical protein
MEFKQAVNKNFEFFCVWLLSIGISRNAKFNVTDDYVKKWLRYHKQVIKGESVKRVIKHKEIGYSTFMALYIYYLACKRPNAKIIVIEKPKYKLKDIIIFIDELLSLTTKEKQIEKKELSKLDFSNGSKIVVMNGTTYNLRNHEGLDLVFFEEFEVSNTDKLYYDIEMAADKSVIEKMVLTITNNLDETHPDIEKTELK